MKKWVCVLAMVLMATNAYAAIDTSWNTVKEPHGNLAFNVNVGSDGENGNPPPDYYPLQVKLDVPMETADGKGKSQVTIYKNVGTNQVEPFDFSTINGLKAVYAALPSWAQGAFEEAVMRALNEVVSQ